MVICVGEILADMVGSKKDNELIFTPKAGGAPFNVACCLRKLGAETVFVGSVGDDAIGRFLSEQAKKRDFDDFLIDVSDDKNTTLAFVSLDDKGERDFSFYRKNTADAYLPRISDELIAKSTIVHIGSLMLSFDIGRDYALELIDRVHKAGKKVSFDVNYRADIFESVENAVSIYKGIIESVDIIKMSSDEYDIFGEEFVKSLRADLICVTLGSKGSKAFYDGNEISVGSISVEPVDTTGAGDAFWGCALRFVDLAIRKKRKLSVETVLKYANICGALNTTGVGAIDYLPDMTKIEEFL